MERYNKCLRERLRKFAAACPGAPWVEHVGAIAAGLRMLPSTTGYSPFLLVHKQMPDWTRANPDHSALSSSPPANAELDALIE